MSFRMILGELIEGIPEAQGAILVDWEGESVDLAGRMDDFDLKVLGAHKGVILTNLRELIAKGRFAGADELHEILITTAQNETLVLPITLDYFLVLTLSRGEALGRARFAAKRCVERLRDEIA